MSSTRSPIQTFKTIEDFEVYLSRQPKASKGFWLKLAKIGAPEATITKQDAIEVSLCCGWIDGQLASLETADRLANQGRLRSAGLAEIDAAKADGRWEAAYASQAKAQVPQDLASALHAHKAAKRFFESLDSANRYAIIYRVSTAKQPQTRAACIAKFVHMLARRETIHPRKAARKKA